MVAETDRGSAVGNGGFQVAYEHLDASEKTMVLVSIEGWS